VASNELPASGDDLELLEFLLEEEGLAATPATIPQRPVDRPPPLSFAQQRLWTLWRTYPGSPAYTIAGALRLSGTLDTAAFHASLNEIVRRHEILRTRFETGADGPSLHILPNLELPLTVMDLSTLPAAQQEQRLQTLCAQAAERTFDLAADSLLDVRLLRLGECEHVALFSLHHLIADGWSMAVFTHELSTLYNAFSNDQPSPLPELAIQYSDFSAWQRQQTDLLATQLDYWQQQLADLPVLDLPTDRPRPAVQTFAGASLAFTVPAELTTALKQLGQSQGASLFMTLLAGFQALLGRYTGQDDIVVGAPVANRNRRELEPLIGFFVNTLALRGDLSGNPSFRTLLARVRDTALAAFEHQDLPFEQLASALLQTRDPSRNPLFQVLFALQNAPSEPLVLPGLTLAPLDIETSIAKFDLTLVLTETETGLEGGFEYNTDLFERATIERMAAHFRNLLESAVAAPDQPIAALPLLSTAERQRLLVDWNDVAVDFPGEGLATLFERQAAATPDAVAVDFDGVTLSYQALNERANRIARHLLTLDVQLEDPVGLCLPPGADVVVAMLAIVKVGGAYVPLNPAYPPARLAYIVQDTGLRLVLTHENLLELLPEDVDAVCLDRDAASIAQASTANPPARAMAEHLAYVIYTSGSTGQPKGIAVTQGAVNRLVFNTNYIDIQPDDGIAQASNFAFDAITFEVWGALLHGARLIGVNRDTSLSPELLATQIRTHGITVLFLTTALFNQVVRARPDAFAPLRYVLFGGEAVDPERVRTALEHGPPRHLLHVYGPTETTTFATWYKVTDIPAGSTTIAIGGPLSNTELYVLDRHGQPVPIGAPGELCIGGAGLARGYVNRPGLTATQFVPHPFAAGARLYRTGDRVRWTADGAIEFLGRFDHQVKIRGFRIEPAEIALVLTRHDNVEDAAVLVRDDTPGRLTAYVCPRAAASPAELRAFLQARLPDYMVPAHYVLLDALPVTANGKLDRTALPPPVDAVRRAAEADTTRPPTTSGEQLLAQIWQSVLGLENIGIDANYFELGGDSISAIQVVSRLQQAGWRLAIQDLFRHPTIAQLAPCLQRIETESSEAQEPVVGPVPLTPIQRWFFERHHDDLHHFNQDVLLASREPFDEAALAAALAALQKHHDALRMCFRQDADGVTQYNQAVDQPLDFSICDLRAEADPDAALTAHAERVQASFNLATGPLFKAVLYQRGDRGDRLLLIVHHLVVDGVSWRILLEDLERGYRQHQAGKPIELGAKTTAFKNWAEALTVYAEDDRLLAERSYWINADAGPNPFAVPTTGDNRFGASAFRRLDLSVAETAELLGGIHHAYCTEAQDILLTALGRALHRWHGGQATARRTVRLLLEGHGREPWDAEINLNRTVGWFTSLYPFVLSVPDAEPGARIKTVKESLRQIPRKGLGYGVLTQLTPPELRQSLGQAPWPQIGFNYLGQFGGGADGLFSLAHEDSGPSISPRLPRQQELDLVAVVTDGQLTLSALFHPDRLAESSVAKFLADWRAELLALIAHCRQQTGSEKTPGDFAVPTLSLAEYERLLQTYGWPAGEIDDVYPLAPMQAGLLFQTLYEPESTAYFVQLSYRLRGRLDLTCFRQSYRILCQRYAVLRTAFVHEDLPQPLQIAFKERAPEIQWLDWRALSPTEQAERIAKFQARDRARGFDLHDPPLMRIGLLQLAPDYYHVVWSYHHLLVDGWCMGVLQRDFGEIYNAIATGRTPDLPPATAYSDYIRWLQNQDRDAARSYWAEYLADYTELTTLPGRRTQPADAEYELRELHFTLPEGLRTLANRCGVTLNTVVQTLWGLLLARYNDTEEAVFGAIVSGRPAQLAGVETAVGLFINAVPVRLRLDETAAPSFVELLKSVQQQALASEPFHYYPLADIQTLSVLGRNLFDHLLIFENFPVEQGVAQEPAGDLVVEELCDIHDRTHYDFDVMIVPAAAHEPFAARLRFHYNGACFTDAQVARIAEHLQTLAQRALADPEAAPTALDPLPDWERQRLIHEFNRAAERATDVVCPADRTVVDWFEAQVARTPAATAIVTATAQLTYAELNALANQLAHGLRENYGITAETRIGILLDRSEWLVIAVLGILKAGAAYVPIDPGYPAARIRFILADSGCPLVLSEARYLAELPADKGVAIQDLLHADADDPKSKAKPQQLAYVIYTSGSTGQPKGCQLEHRQLLHYLHWADNYYFDDASGGTFGLYSPLSFDLTVTSLFLTLLRGKTLHIFPQQADIETILRQSLDPASAIDSIKLTPSHISLLPHLDINETNVRLAIVGGEALSREQIGYLQRLNPNMAIYNEYGPTETTVGCVVKRVTADAERAPIGRPIANTQIYIADRQQRLLPLGAVGEILIAGAGVARGYLNRDELTQEKFIANPFAAGERLYRSGDLGRWLENGELDFLGRRDEQFKIRGYRIEAGEIEHALRQQPAVRETVVLAWQGELAAYWTGADAAIADLREHLSRQLPEHMIPAYFVQLEKLPLTPNGKVDRRALPLPAENQTSAAQTAPRTALEAQLLAIWQDVLGVNPIGVDDNFFELGGHSLKAMQIVARIRKTRQVELSLQDFFRLATVAALGERLDAAASRAAFQPIPLAPPQEHYVLSPAQQRLWLQHQIAPSAYNMPDAFVLPEPLDSALLARAFDRLIERHEILRTAFIDIDGEPRQQILPPSSLAIRREDLSTDEQAKQRARTIAEQVAAEPFDLSKPPLVRVVLIDMPDQRQLFLLTVHHIIGDGWSRNVLYRELLAWYDACRNNLPDPLEPLRIQYKDYAVWQQHQRFAQSERYWLKQLADAPGEIRLPYDNALAERRFRGDRRTLTLAADIARGLRAQATKSHTTLAVVLLALFKLFLYQLSRQADLCVGMSVANRDHPDLENLIGFFVNVAPIRSRLNPDMPFEQLLEQVARTTAEALTYQDYPFDLLVRKINPSGGGSGRPFINVAYGFQHSLETEDTQSNSADTATAFNFAFETAKFDLTLVVNDDGNQLDLMLEYDADLFLAATIERYLKILERFARQLAN